MRERIEIEKEIKNKSELHLLNIVCEILLDIRDLLNKDLIVEEKAPK